MVRSHSLPRPWARCSFVLVFASIASAQEPPAGARSPEDLERRWEAKLAEVRQSYEGRIAQLENRVVSLEGSLSEQRVASDEAALAQQVDEITRRGLSSLGQTTQFNNVFNPGISVLGDFVLSISDRDDSFNDLNRFTLREVELGIVGRVDPYFAYYVFLHFDPDEVELEEAYGIADDWLPGTFSLEFGRYNVDFGKLSPIHDAELPFVDKPGVFQEYLGGSLRGTGLELHHWFGLGDEGLLRWSVGVTNRPQGDVHPVVSVREQGHAHGESDELDGLGEREIEDFALNARVTAIFDLSARSTLQIGASLLWAPHVREFEAAGAEEGRFADGEKDPLVRFDLAQRTVGADLTYRWTDPSTAESLTLSGEILFHHQRFESDEPSKLPAPDAFVSGDTFAEDAWGFYVYGEYAFGPRWSAGASCDWFERAADPDSDWFDLGAFVTWRPKEFNRLRAELRWFDDDAHDEEFWAFFLQWTIVLGSHGHGLPW